MVFSGVVNYVLVPLCKIGSENVTEFSARDLHAVWLAMKSGATAFNHSEIKLNPVLTCLNGFSRPLGRCDVFASKLWSVP